MVDVSYELLFDIVGIISIACFAWAWRLQSQLTKLETVQTIKVERLCSIDKQLIKLIEQFNELKGMMIEHLKK